LTQTALAEPLVLPSDVVLVPVADLSQAARLQLNCQDGDVAITRPRLRTPSRLVSAGAAELLREFVSPSTVVEAVIRSSRARGDDPEATLEGAYPLLARLVREGFLVSASDARARSIEASWEAGERIAGCTVQCCLQVLEDTEVYQVRAGPARREAALKIERPAGGGGGTAQASAPAGGAAAAVAAAGGAAGAAAGGAEGDRAALAGAAGAAGGRASRRRAPARSGVAARLDREAAILAHLGRLARAGPGTVAPAGTADPVAPRLLAAGRWQECRFLLLEWCAGVDAQTAAAEARERGGEAGRAAILAVCGAVAGAYATLHRQGVLHCDVHPRNVLVAAGGGVRLIDFGLACRQRGGPAELAHAERGGVAFYFEPEYAVAALAGKRPPAVTAAGEQYAVAALLYLLAAGAHYLDFSLERETMLRQIAELPPRTFAERGAGAWPELEAVLGRALAKAPADRFPSLDALAATLLAVPVAAAAAAAAAARAAATPVADLGSAAREGTAAEAGTPSLAIALRPGGPAAELLAEVLARVRPGGRLWESGLPEAPFASVQFGAAGVALGLYRMALAREDAELLAQADLWSARAASAEHGGGAAPDPAFYDPRLDVTPETVGRASLLHTAPGVRCTAALIANALDDRAGAASATAAFVAAARQPCPSPDLALGRSGLLLGGALLVDALGGDAGVDAETDAGAGVTKSPPAAPPAMARPPGGALPPPPPAPPGTPHLREPLPALLALGDQLLAGIWRQLDPLPPLAACPEAPNLGMAHGWAGYLYATLRWCQAAARPLPAGLAARLRELAGSAESWGRGARWRWHGQPLAEGHRLAAPAAPRWMAGWCNGSAGMVHLWTLASRTPGLSSPADPGTGPRDAATATGPDCWMQLAHLAAWHAWEADDQVETLCCGLAGRAYALLDLYQSGAGPEWLARARILADRAAAISAAAVSGAAAEDPDASRPHGLYRGQLGIAVLAADLERPELAAMPLFGDERWAAPRAC
jgi:eukaryotic-like serine/threonine-protein kinase